MSIHGLAITTLWATILQVKDFSKVFMKLSANMQRRREGRFSMLNAYGPDSTEN